MISIAKEKIAKDRIELDDAKMPLDSIENLKEEINDIEFAIDDLKVYANRLRNIPKPSF